MEPLPDDRVVAHQHAADHRVRRRGAPAALRELERAVEVRLVGGGQVPRGRPRGAHALHEVVVRGGRIGRGEDRGAGREPVRARPGAVGDRRGADAAVDLDARRPGRASARRAVSRSSDDGMNDWPPQPGLTLMQSRLSARPATISSLSDRRARVERHARRHAGLADALQPVVQVRRGLDVDGVGVGPGLRVVVDEPLGALDHHVHRERTAGVVHDVGDGRDDARAERDHRDEVAVHDVDVERARTGVEQLLDAGPEGPEVGGEDRGADLYLGQPGGRDSTPAVSWIGRGGCAGAAGTGARGVVPFADAPSPRRCRSRPRARSGRAGRRGDRHRHQRVAGVTLALNATYTEPAQKITPGADRLRRQRHGQDGAPRRCCSWASRMPAAARLAPGTYDTTAGAVITLDAGAVRRRWPAASRCRTPSRASRTPAPAELYLTVTRALRRRAAATTIKVRVARARSRTSGNEVPKAFLPAIDGLATGWSDAKGARHVRARRRRHACASRRRARRTSRRASTAAARSCSTCASPTTRWAPTSSCGSSRRRSASRCRAASTRAELGMGRRAVRRLAAVPARRVRRPLEVGPADQPEDAREAHGDHRQGPHHRPRARRPERRLRDLHEVHDALPRLPLPAVDAQGRRRRGRRRARPTTRSAVLADGTLYFVRSRSGCGKGVQVMRLDPGKTTPVQVATVPSRPRRAEARRDAVSPARGSSCTSGTRATSASRAATSSAW